MTNFPACRAGGVQWQWQCASAFSTCFRGEVLSCKGPARCSSHLDSEPPLSCNSIKKKVALWIGYVGTHYKGLQIQRSTAAGQRLEEFLKAILGPLRRFAGCVAAVQTKGYTLCQQLFRSRWRLIKKLGEMMMTEFRSFDPRRGCCSRTYHYLLPAATLGITGNTCDEEVQQRLVRFQNILSSLEGRHPYHNYTVRSQYQKKSHASRMKNDAMEEEGNLLPPEDFSFEEYQLSDHVTSKPENLILLSSTSSRAMEVAEKISLPPPKIRWLHELDRADKIFSAHFRRVFSFTCGGLQKCQGLYFLKLSVHGESFMLHQIRKMVGTAIAIMREVLPADIIPISLSRLCRVTLPLAPSDGLFLACNEFYPFRTNWFKPKGSEELDDLPRLKMSAMVLKKKEEFWHNVLLPHMITLLQDSNALWNDWLELLEGGKIPEADMDYVREAWREMVARLQE